MPLGVVSPSLPGLRPEGTATVMGSTPEERLKPLEELRADSGSLNAGPVNFGRSLFRNTPELMELYAKRLKEFKVMLETSKADRGVLTIEKELVNQKGEVVQTGTTSVLLAKREKED